MKYEYQCLPTRFTGGKDIPEVITDWLNELAEDGWRPIGCNSFDRSDSTQKVWTFERLAASDKYQTRRHSGELRYFATLEEAMDDAHDPEVWKISFEDGPRSRVRLIRDASDQKFYFEPIIFKEGGL